MISRNEKANKVSSYRIFNNMNLNKFYNKVEVIFKKVDSLLSSKMFNKYRIISLLVFLTLNIIFISFYTSHNEYFNADSTAEIVLGQGNIIGETYYMPQHDYIIKLPFFFIINAVLGYTKFAYQLTNFLDTFVMFSSVALLAIVFFGKKHLKTTVVSTLWILYLSPMFINFVVHPGIPNAEYAVIFFTLYIFLFTKKLKNNPIVILLCILFNSFVIASDPLILFIFPILLFFALAIYFYKNNTLKPLNTKFWFVIVSSVLGSFLINYILTKTGYLAFSSNDIPQFVSFEHLYINFNLTIEGILKMYNAYFFDAKFSVLKTVGFLVNLLLLTTSTIGLIKMFMQGLTKKSFFMIFIPVAFISTILIYMLSTRPEDVLTSRFFTIIPFLSLFGLIFMIKNSARSMKYVYTALILFAVIINFRMISSFLETAKYPTKDQYQNYIVSTLKENNLSYGYGGYWHSSVTTYYSNYEISMRPVLCTDKRNIIPYRFISKESWYTESTYTGSTFLIVDNLGGDTVETKFCNQADIVKQFGSPKKTILINNYDRNVILYIFDHNIARNLKA